MKQCYGCKIKEVCKIYDFLKIHDHITTVEITHCRMKPSETEVHVPVDSLQGIHKPAPIKDYKNFNQSSNELRNQESAFKNMVDDIKINLEEVDVKIIETSPISGSILVECPTCKGKTTDDDLNICAGNDCTTIVCSNCATGTSKGAVCETCWNK